METEARVPAFLPDLDHSGHVYANKFEFAQHEKKIESGCYATYFFYSTLNLAFSPESPENCICLP